MSFFSRFTNGDRATGASVSVVRYKRPLSNAALEFLVARTLKQDAMEGPGKIVTALTTLADVREIGPLPAHTTPVLHQSGNCLLPSTLSSVAYARSPVRGSMLPTLSVQLGVGCRLSVCL